MISSKKKKNITFIITLSILTGTEKGYYQARKIATHSF